MKFEISEIFSQNSPTKFVSCFAACQWRNDDNDDDDDDDVLIALSRLQMSTVEITEL